MHKYQSTLRSILPLFNRIKYKSPVPFAHRHHLVSSFDKQNFHKRYRLSLSLFFLLYNPLIKSVFSIVFPYTYKPSNVFHRVLLRLMTGPVIYTMVRWCVYNIYYIHIVLYGMTGIKVSALLLFAYLILLRSILYTIYHILYANVKE